MDRIDAARRSANMRRIGANNTSVELALRTALRQRGLSGYRLHPRDVVGKPDIAYTKWKVAVFVDGCFWHACPICYVRPSSNMEYWDEKRERNRRRDGEVTSELQREGWTVIRIWEHEVQGALDEQVKRISGALHAAGR